MKPFQANILNAAVLILMGLWGYLSSESPSPTALIPVAFGVLFLLATPPFKNDNKIVAHVIVLLTFFLILMLIRPLLGAIDKNNQMAIIRVSLMIVAGIIAMIFYIRNFIAVRKARQAAEEG